MHEHQRLVTEFLGARFRTDRLSLEERVVVRWRDDHHQFVGGRSRYRSGSKPRRHQCHRDQSHASRQFHADLLIFYFVCVAIRTFLPSSSCCRHREISGNLLHVPPTLITSSHFESIRPIDWRWRRTVPVKLPWSVVLSLALLCACCFRLNMHSRLSIPFLKANSARIGLSSEFLGFFVASALGCSQHRAVARRPEFQRRGLCTQRVRAMKNFAAHRQKMLDKGRNPS